MKVKSLKKYKMPEYPDYEILLKNRRFLGNHLSENWKKNSTIITALTVFLLSGIKELDSANILSKQNTTIQEIKNGKTGIDKKSGTERNNIRKKLNKKKTIKKIKWHRFFCMVKGQDQQAVL